MTSIIRRKILLGGFTILLINCANNRYLLIDATQELSIASTSSIRLNESYHRQHHSQYYDRRHPLQVDDSMQTRRDKLYEIRGEDKIRGIVSSSVRGGGAGVFMLGGDAGVRTVASIVMLGIVTLIVKVFREQGIYGLLLLFQAVMYKEACQVVGARDRVSADTSFVPIKVQQIWWFLTALAGSSLHHLKVFGPSNLYGNLVTYLMAAVGLVMGVLTMAQDGASEELFRGYLGKVASSHFALIFLVWQSSTWFLTLQEFGIAWFLLPALLVIVNDTMAYVFGRLFGNHKLIPNLSPKKTWEGFIGAALSTILAAHPLLSVFNLESDLANKQHVTAIAVYVSLISPFGGFLASAVKRAYGAKDFGSFIPGHGGAIDRLDCQVVTAPFVYFYLKTFG
eukprot:CAMPEP_0116054584 /NCGR_PEP_ID=MMETSP0322-20121206/2890_1 /TAXON_ID=163516 /ORGANISM="Leptocylindrus danicus var. apora, Strain B651" /LENGTH=394 /DNA_ID=CAMNT_0003538007 /DNA_START=173 /DNA_END=1357 /DNA_ORIENTATION=-